MATQETVLITGGNGYIGYATIVKALRAGYRVRATARRQEAVDFVRSRGQSIEAFERKGALEWFILSNTVDREMFAEAALGCTYIIHVAFPLGNNPGDLHKVAIDGVGAMLYAAEQNKTVRRIVWTSSTSGITQFEHVHYDHPTAQKLIAGGVEAESVPVLTPETSVPLPSSVNENSPPYHWYGYGKIAAVKALREYAAKDPSFDIIILFPGWTLGPNELNRTKKEAFDGKSTNSFLLFLYQDFSLNPIIGRPLGDEPWIPAAFAHIDDVSEGHVKALQVATQDKRLRSFILCSDGSSGPQVGSAIRIVREKFPSEAAQMYHDAKYNTIPMKMDYSQTESDLLGHPMKTYATAVEDTIGWYSKLSES